MKPYEPKDPTWRAMCAAAQYRDDHPPEPGSEEERKQARSSLGAIVSAVMAVLTLLGPS
jgi:hypothetical protein